MEEEDRREILRRVAEGTLSPAEAAVLLSQVDASTLRDGDGPLRCVRIVGQFGTARVTGDTGVREAVAEGPHQARRDGDTLVIESLALDDFATGIHGFSFSRSDRPWRHFARGARTIPLNVRMHPDIPLEVELSAGTLSVRDVKSTIHAEVSAGTVRIDGFASPVDIGVASGTVRAEGVLDKGASRVRCEAGTVRVHLRRGSSVRVSARAGLGKVVIPEESGAPSRGWLVGGTREATVGRGAGTLEVEASMGTVHVSAD